MTYIDEGLWVEILKRATAKTLIRFRCVCKSWKSLISSPSFAALQLSYSRSTYSSTGTPPDDNHTKPYILFGPGLSNRADWYAIYNPPPHQHDDDDDQLPRPIGFRPVPFTSSNHYYVMEVIHGVVCLSHGYGIYFTTQPFPADYSSTILWNPAMQRHVCIPPSSRPLDLNEAWMSNPHDVGFGFDARNNAFKVVRIWPPFPAIEGYDDIWYTPKFEVFSTLDLRWRRVVADHLGPFSFLPNYRSLFQNGAIHWVVQRHINGSTHQLVILMFDCEREELKTIELPLGIKESRGSKHLFSYRGMVAVWAAVKSERVLEVWAMEEYGVASSWKKLRRDHPEKFVIIDEPGRNQTGEFERIDGLDGLKGSHHPLNGRIFEPSFFLVGPERSNLYYNDLSQGLSIQPWEGHVWKARM